MTDSDEPALIERCRRGDQDAFRDLVERHQSMVYGLAIRLTGDVAEAEDLTQEVFLRIYRGLPYFRGEARLGTWIYRIVMNLCAQRRSSQAGRTIALDAADGRRVREPMTDDHLVRRLEQEDLVKKAMATLPPQYQLVVAAHYLDGVQYEELADALGVPLGTVKTHLHRARRLLREALGSLLQNREGA